MLPAGRLPELRNLRLYGLPGDMAEVQEFLGSDLAARLQALTLAPREEEQGEDLVRRLTEAPAARGLSHLGLSWTVSPAEVQALTGSGAWPRLTSLQLGCMRLGAGGQALADWPLLSQLRQLTLRNSSFGEVPGLAPLARSPHLTPLLRVDIHNGSLAQNDRALLRERMAGRLSVAGRKEPRMVHLGGWGRILGDDE
jgi:hypothetical protein